jgi:hypothetical protein
MVKTERRGEEEMREEGIREQREGKMREDEREEGMREKRG